MISLNWEEWRPGTKIFQLQGLGLDGQPHEEHATNIQSLQVQGLKWNSESVSCSPQGHCSRSPSQLGQSANFSGAGVAGGVAVGTTISAGSGTTGAAPTTTTTRDPAPPPQAPQPPPTSRTVGTSSVANGTTGAVNTTKGLAGLPPHQAPLLLAM